MVIKLFCWALQRFESVFVCLGTQESADQRLKRGTELFQNIKALKLFVWEQLMTKRVEDARETQLKFLFKAACLKAVMSK